eukprot:2447692-Pyramimonas_sp.AAC.1
MARRGIMNVRDSSDEEERPPDVPEWLQVRAGFLLEDLIGVPRDAILLPSLTAPESLIDTVAYDRRFWETVGYFSQCPRVAHLAVLFIDAANAAAETRIRGYTALTFDRARG